jgi:GDP-4-dehydro-6-deoxy-D-mannose reductase
VHVLVTGALGFVGRRLASRLAAAGARVTGVDRELEVSDAGAVEEALARIRPDAVVHLAALSSVSESWHDPRSVYRVNFLGSRAVLEAVRRHLPRARLLLVGSGAIYGRGAPGQPPFDESSPLQPDSPYAWSKAAADRLGRVYAAAGLAVLRCRPFNHTGPGRPPIFVESALARQIAEIELGRREARLHVGNLDSVRDFLDVDDVVDAYLALLRPEVPPGVYNLASGVGQRIGDVLEMLLAHTRVRPELEVDPSLVRPSESSVGCAARLRAATGWAPRRPLAATLGALLDAWRQELRAA